jgi:hypothetical protein
MRFSRWPSAVLLAYCVCLQVGCSGGGGSQGHSVPPNPVPTLSGLSPNFANAVCALLTVTASRRQLYFDVSNRVEGGGAGHDLCVGYFADRADSALRSNCGEYGKCDGGESGARRRNVCGPDLRSQSAQHIRGPARC